MTSRELFVSNVASIGSKFAPFCLNESMSKFGAVTVHVAKLHIFILCVNNTSGGTAQRNDSYPHRIDRARSPSNHALCQQHTWQFLENKGMHTTSWTYVTSTCPVVTFNIWTQCDTIPMRTILLAISDSTITYFSHLTSRVSFCMTFHDRRIFAWSIVAFRTLSARLWHSTCIFSDCHKIPYMLLSWHIVNRYCRNSLYKNDNIVLFWLYHFNSIISPALHISMLIAPSGWSNIAYLLPHISTLLEQDVSDRTIVAQGVHKVNHKGGRWICSTWVQVLGQMLMLYSLSFEFLSARFQLALAVVTVRRPVFLKQYTRPLVAYNISIRI